MFLKVFDGNPLIRRQLNSLYLNLPIPMSGEPRLYLEDAGEVIGGLWATVTPNEAVFTIGIKLHYRRKGLGRQLITEFVRRCPSRTIRCSAIHPATVKIIRELGFEQMEEYECPYPSAEWLYKNKRLLSRSPEAVLNP